MKKECWEILVKKFRRNEKKEKHAFYVTERKEREEKNKNIKYSERCTKKKGNLTNRELKRGYKTSVM